MKWWLRRFGASINGETPAEYIADHGLPLELVDVVEAFCGSKETWGRYQTELQN